MGNSIQDKSSQKEYIKNRIDLLVDVLDSIDAETAGIDEIDKIISMLDELEEKCKQFRYDWEEK
ncbi:SE1561 family protein [Fictibacillus halophilus]|jgi:prefoldin subunit 5|uniref:SE1561 family protein n=1 Tax=Fictibacillus halophilus TaxID=1610490 RepID=UPI003631FE9F